MDTPRRLPVDESFASVAEHAPAMLWRGDAEGNCIYLNRAQRRFWGVADGDLSGFTWSSTLVEEDAPKVFGPFAEGMAKREAFTCEARYRRFDGVIRILKTNAEPCFDETGVFTGMIGVNVDVTEEREAEARLSDSEARLRSLADNLPYGMIFQIVRSANGERRFAFVSSQCLALNGVEAEVAMADPASLYNLILPEYQEAFARAEREAAEAMRPFEFETKMRRADGEVRWHRIASAPRAMPNGDVVWDGVQIDIHDIKAGEERKLFLMKEMSHRIKNNLSTVISIATQTGRSSSSYEAFNASFQARLRALAKSHDLLMQDARDSANLREILEAELLPYSSDSGSGRSLTLNGESVNLTGRAAIGLALVVHELATNAAKYGAYAGGGSLEISWRVRADLPGAPVELVWRERGGPPVSPPEKLGFGSRLIDGVLRAELGGGVVTRYEVTGFEADLTFHTAIAQ